MATNHALAAARSARHAMNYTRRKHDRPAMEEDEWNVLRWLAQQAQERDGMLPDATTMDPAQLGVMGELAATLCVRSTDDGYIWPRLTQSALSRADCGHYPA